MPANLSFNLQGATPFKQDNPFNPFNNYKPGSLGSNPSPVSTALTGMGINQSAPATATKITTPPNALTQQPSQTQAGLIPPANAAVKSHTVSNADGSTVSQTYHAPAATTSSSATTPAPAPASQLGSVTSGLIGFGGGQSPTASSAQSGLQNISNDSNTYQGIDGNYYYSNQTDPSTGGALRATNQGNVQKAQQNLQNLSQNPTAEVALAEKEYNDFNKQNPYMLAAQFNPNVAADVASGRDALLGQTFAAEQAAKAQQVQNALTGQGQQITAANEAAGNALTGQGNQITAGQNAGNLALTGRGQDISALQSAGNLSQPVSQFGVLGTPQSVGAFGSNSGSAAFQGGFIGGQQAAGQTAAQMSVANTAAKGIEGTIQQYLASNPQLNSSSSTIANAAQQWLSGKQLGDPTYQTLFNYLNEYISTLAPVLGVGGDTTNLKTEIAQSFINAKASGQSISQVLQNIGSLADQKLQNIVSAGQGGGQVAGGVPVGQTPTSFSTSW